MFSKEQLKAIRLKHKGHRASANYRGLGQLPFEIYVEKMVEANITPDQIGCTKGKYQLCRYTDTGDYTKDSCRFDTMENNIKDKHINGGFVRGAQKLKGRTGPSTVRTELNTKSIIAARRIEFCFIDPQGIIHSGENIDLFSRQHSLTAQQMHNVQSGKRKSHKGWTKGS